MGGQMLYIITIINMYVFAKYKAIAYSEANCYTFVIIFDYITFPFLSFYFLPKDKSFLFRFVNN